MHLKICVGAVGIGGLAVLADVVGESVVAGDLVVAGESVVAGDLVEGRETSKI